MTQDPVYAEDEAEEFQASPGIGTQLLALGSAACVGFGLFFGSILLGVALFAVVLITMNVDAGSGWATRIRNPAERRNSRVAQRVSQPAVIR